MGTQVCSCEYSKSFRNSFFYSITPVPAFELYFSIRKEFLQKVSGEIAFELVSLFHVQIQEPISRSTTMRALVFLGKFAQFYITKYFKQEDDDDSSICVDECNPCGFFITRDVKIYQYHMIKW